MGPDDLDPGFVPCLRAQVTAVPVADEAVLYDERTGELYRLDRVAEAVCVLLDGQLSIASVVDELTERFAAPREMVESDVIAMVRDLGRHGLLMGVDSTHSVASDAAGDSAPERPER